MSSKAYHANSSTNTTYTAKTKPQNTTSSLNLQTKGENELNAVNSEYSAQTGGMIANVQRTIESGNYQPNLAPIQAKLTIGAPGDQYEQEADQVASEVVQRINDPSTSQASNIQRKPQITMVTPKLQRREQPNQLSSDLIIKPLIQRQEAIAQKNATANLETGISSARGRGQALDPTLQRSMGGAMGADFSKVRIHTDSHADQLNQSIQAKAFTTGHDVFFRQGEYNPGSRGGQELIAHELTHVVQQNGGGNNATIQRYMGVLSEKAFKYNTTSKFNVFGMGRGHLSEIDKALEAYDDLFQASDFYKVIPTHEDEEPACDSESSLKETSQELWLRKRELKILNQLEMLCKVPESQFKKYGEEDQSAIEDVARLVKRSIKICVKLIDKLDKIVNPDRAKIEAQKKKESSPEYQKEMKEKAKQTTKEKEDKFLNDIRENRAKAQANEQAKINYQKANEQARQEARQKEYEEAVLQAPNNIKIAKENLMSVEQFKQRLMSPPHNLSESHFKDHEIMKPIVDLLTQFHATSAEDIETIVPICRQILLNLDKYIKFIQARAEASTNIRVKQEIDQREQFINEAIYFVVEKVVP